MLDLKMLTSRRISRLLAIALVLAVLIIPAGASSLRTLATRPDPLAVCDDSTCLSRCNAKEIQAIDLWLGDPVTGQRQQQCEPGTVVQTSVWATIDANTLRYAPRLAFDLWVDGVFDRHYNVCFSDVLSDGLNSYAAIPITWTCGSELVANNLSLIWSNDHRDTCATVTCCPDVPSKCQGWVGDVIIVSPLVADFTATSPCAGTAVQFTDATTGGTAPYTYTWAFGDGGTSSLASPTHLYASPGTYTVALTVTDSTAPALTDAVTHTVTVNAAPIPAISATPGLTLTCNVHSIELGASATGGTSPYGYAWDLDNDGAYDDATGVTTTVTAAGTYGLLATSSSGCTGTTSVSVVALGPVDVQIAATPGLTLTCSTDLITLTASATGGDGLYTYAWDLDHDGYYNDGTGASKSVAAAGTYGVQVTDGSGCTDSASVTVDDQRDLDVQITPDPGLTLTCSVNGITLTASASGGSHSYAYAWDLDNDGQYDDGTGATQSVTSAGTYGVQVTDGNLCTATDSVIVVDHRDLDVQIAATPGLTLTCNVQSISLTASASGGSGSYSYAWDLDNDGLFDDGTGATQSVTSAGTYAVQVTNGDSCTDADSVTVVDQRDLDVQITPDTDLVLTCNVPSIVLTATATGGSGSYAYAWDLDNDGQFDDGTGATQTVTAAGAYAVRATDGNGCPDTDSVTVADQRDLDVQITPDTDLVLTCNLPSIALTATASGGSGSYSYAWDLDNDGLFDDGTGATQSVTSAGPYAVRATDAGGCTDTDSVTVVDHRNLDVQITPDTDLVLSCNVQSIELVAAATGGSGSYTYAWDLDDDGQFDDGTGTTQTVSAGGTYAVQVTNGGGCTDTDSVTVDDQRDLDVQITPDTDPVLTCNVPSIVLTATATGGSGSYAYAWDLDNDGQFDDGTGATQTVTAAGAYAVQATDGNRCTATDSVTVADHRDLGVEITAAPGLILTCNTQGITLTAAASGGSGSYTYAWDLDGDGLYDDATGSVQTISNVSEAGTYAVQATNGGGCTATDSVTVVDQRDLTVGIEASATEVTCEAPEVTLTASASGGDGSYSYAWDLDGDGQFDDGTGATQTVTAAGDYAVQVTDGSGCTNTDSVTIGEDPCVPGLSVTKTANRDTAKVGNVIKYTIVVENTGENALENVVVTDTKLGININLGTLEVGASATVTGTYKVQQHDMPGPIVNTAWATADGGLTDSSTWKVYLTGEPPEPCRRADLSVLIYGGWNGITVNADPGGSQATGLDSNGVAAVLFTYYLDPGQSMSVHVTPQLPPELDPAQWKFVPATRTATVKPCETKQITFQLVNYSQPEELLLPVTGDQRGFLAIMANLWQSLLSWLRNLVK